MILAIDLGSTNFKAAVFDSALERLGERSCVVPYLRNDGEGAELDPEAVWRAVVDSIRGACAAAGIATTAVESVAVGSQAQTFTVLDDSGHARLPLISWLDYRGGSEVDEGWGTLAPHWHHHCSFASLPGNLMLAHLMWVRRHEPAALEGNPAVAALPSLVYHRLCGVTLLDRNLAAMSGLYSLQRGDWWTDALSCCGLGARAMPRLVDVGEGVPLCTRCADLRLRDTIRLVPAGNDQTAGAYGNGCGPGDVVATMGTALVAYRYAGAQPGPYSAKGCWGPYPGGGYYEMAVRDTGCQALDWARCELMPGVGVAEFDAAAARGSETVRADSGLFRPERIRTSAAWHGVFEGLDQRAYAVLEGIAFSLRELVRGELACPAGAAVHAIGGGSRSHVWLQVVADVLDAPVMRGRGDSLLGAARMAAGPRADGPDRNASRFDPDASRRALLDRRFERYRRD